MSQDQKEVLFSQIAVECGFITKDDVTAVTEKKRVDEAVGAKKPIASYYLDLGKLTREQIGKIISIQEERTNSNTKARWQAALVLLLFAVLGFATGGYIKGFGFLIFFIALYFNRNNGLFAKLGRWSYFGICFGPFWLAGLFSLAIIAYPQMCREQQEKYLEQLESKVRTSISLELLKDPRTQDWDIEKVTLSHTSGNTYQGRVYVKKNDSERSFKITVEDETNGSFDKIPQWETEKGYLRAFD